MSRLDLVADCERCAALCCVAPAFDRSGEFAFDKQAGVRCPNLTATNRCRIHGGLVVLGFSGCAAFDCHGAGQSATARFAAEPERVRHDGFLALRAVHELVWLATGALRFAVDEELRARLGAELEALESIARLDARALLETNLGPHEATVKSLLCELRETVPRPRQ